MRDWKLRDTVMVIFMVAVVIIMFMQMAQNDRLYDRVSQMIHLLESGSIGLSAQSSCQSNQWRVPEAEPGGTVTIRYSAQPANLNPLTYKDHYASIVLGDAGVYESLLEYDPKTLQLRGLLAESWSLSEDKLSITFKIKSEACWNDGRPVTAQDVEFSFRAMMIPTLDAQRMQTYYIDCEKVEAIDEKTVVFKWKKRYFKSLEQSGGLFVIPKHVLDPDNLIDTDTKALAQRLNQWNFLWEGKPQVSSGPYMMESWDKTANRVVLKRNERYWGPKPALQRLVFRFISNEDAAIQALKAGEIDAMWLNTEQWQNQTNDEAFLKNYIKKKYLRVTAGYNYIGYNERRKPFDDRRVRRALGYCMPRELIRGKIFYNLRELANGPFGLVSKQSSPNVGQLPFAPEKAKQLLAEAGFKDADGDGVLEREGKPFEFSLSMPAGSAQYEQVLALFQDELAKIGVKMSIDPYEWSVFEEKLNKRDYEACILAWTGAIENDPFQIWHSSSRENRGSNHIGYNNPEVDRLIEEARQEFDVDKRNAMYHRIHEIIFEDQPYTFLFTGPSLMVHSKRIKNVNTTPLGVNFLEWWIPRSERRHAG